MTVQLRYIGRWSAKLGDRRLASLALGLLALGLMLTATTPESPHPLYLRPMVERDLLSAHRSTTEALIGGLGVNLPADENRGFSGVVWLFVAIVPVSIGAGRDPPGFEQSNHAARAGGLNTGVSWASVRRWSAQQTPRRH